LVHVTKNCLLNFLPDAQLGATWEWVLRFDRQYTVLNIYSTLHRRASAEKFPGGGQRKKRPKIAPLSLPLLYQYHV